MQKVILPCNADGTLPFVTVEGMLPCPALSTMNALRYLEQKPEALSHGQPRAIARIERIFQKGAQVEWLECETFLQWQLHVETFRAVICAGGTSRARHGHEVCDFLEVAPGKCK